MRIIIVAPFILAVFIGCSNPPDYPNEPVISFESISKDTLRQSDLNTDSLFVRISYTDGDGDLGFSSSDTNQSIFVTDVRTGFIQDRYKLPEIPDQGTANGIFGTITFLMYTTCCIFPQGIPPCSTPAAYPVDTVQYEIYIIDQAGHVSNKIKTPPITLLCR